MQIKVSALALRASGIAAMACLDGSTPKDSFKMHFMFYTQGFTSMLKEISP
jgi:hypothetical protein